MRAAHRTRMNAPVDAHVNESKSTRIEEVATLDDETATSIASLIAIGCQSGATVLGLSTVRRTLTLACILVDSRLAAGTVRQLSARRDVKLYKVATFTILTGAFGRPDIRVLGVRQGELAQGIAAKLAESRADTAK